MLVFKIKEERIRKRKTYIYIFSLFSLLFFYFYFYTCQYPVVLQVKTSRSSFRLSFSFFVKRETFLYVRLFFFQQEEEEKIKNDILSLKKNTFILN